jgi:transposase
MSYIRTRGKKSTHHPDPEDPPRRRANKQPGHGTYETDRPPIFSIISRETKQARYFIKENSDAESCLAVVISSVPTGATIKFNTDEWNGYNQVSTKLGIQHSTVRHSRDEQGEREWARDDDGDGKREVHCNSCEGGGTSLRNFLRAFRGVHKQYLDLYVATYEITFNAKMISSAVIQKMCFGLEIYLLTDCT